MRASKEKKRRYISGITYIRLNYCFTIRRLSVHIGMNENHHSDLPLKMCIREFESKTDEETSPNNGMIEIKQTKEKPNEQIELILIQNASVVDNAHIKCEDQVNGILNSDFVDDGEKEFKDEIGMENMKSTNCKKKSKNQNVHRNVVQE